MNDSLAFCLVEHKSKGVSSFEMLKVKWEIDLSASSDQDLILPGSLEYLSSAGPPREQGNNLIRYVGSSLSLVHEAQNYQM